jgi:hypothetical protein
MMQFWSDYLDRLRTSGNGAGIRTSRRRLRS